MSRSEKQPLNESREATSPNYAAIAVGVGAAFALVALAVAGSGAAGLRGSGVAVASLYTPPSPDTACVCTSKDQIAACDCNPGVKAEDIKPGDPFLW